MVVSSSTTASRGATSFADFDGAWISDPPVPITVPGRDRAQSADRGHTLLPCGQSTWSKQPSTRTALARHPLLALGPHWVGLGLTSTSRLRSYRPSIVCRKALHHARLVEPTYPGLATELTPSASTSTMPHTVTSRNHPRPCAL